MGRPSICTRSAWAELNSTVGGRLLGQLTSPIAACDVDAAGTQCAEALAACTPPWEALLKGPYRFGGGAQRAVMLARLAQRYRLEFTSCADPEALRAVGLSATTESASTRHPSAMRIPKPFLRLPQLREP